MNVSNIVLGENVTASTVGVLLGAVLAIVTWIVYPQFAVGRVLLPTNRVSWFVIFVLFGLAAGIATTGGGLLVSIVATWLPLFTIELHAYTSVYGGKFLILPFESTVTSLAVFALVGAIPIGTVGYAAGVASRQFGSHYTK